MTQTIQNISAPSQNILDRAREWVNENYPDCSAEDYAARVASACEEIAIIDAANQESADLDASIYEGGN